MIVDGECKVSIVIVCHNVNEYILEAMQSAFDQTLRGIEILVIENGSTDGGRDRLRALLDANKGRFQLIECGENLDLGIARNIGIDAARGEYLVFLDGDDWLETSALEILYTIAKKFDADVVSFGFRKHRCGTVAMTAKRHGEPRFIESVSDRAKLVAPGACDKIYRTRFLRSSGFRFRPGFYEDVDWGMLIAMKAGRLVAISDELLNYRIRPGSITNSYHDRHLDITTRLENFIAVVAKDGVLRKAYEPWLASLILRRYRAILVSVGTRISWKSAFVLIWRARRVLRQLTRKEVSALGLFEKIELNAILFVPPLFFLLAANRILRHRRKSRSLIGMPTHDIGQPARERVFANAP